MIEGLKPLYNRILRPCALFLDSCGLTPNTVTLVGIILFLVGGAIMGAGYWKTAVLIGTIGAFMDGMDGIIARECGKKSVFGGVFDSVSDRITEIAAIGGALWWYLHNPALREVGVLVSFFALSGSLMVSYVRARAEGAGLSCSGGIMQRPERLVLFGICGLCGPSVMIWGLGIMAALTWYTTVERMVMVKGICEKEVKDR